MKDLFGYKAKEKASIHVKLFCDEIITGDWMYIGMLIVPAPIEQKLMQTLLNKRCGNPKASQVWGACSPPCKYHPKNNTEVHFGEVEKSKDKYFISLKWIDFLVNDSKHTYFYVLGIDLSRIDKVFFGKRKQGNIYNRFFRTAILKSLKTYFADYQQIIIDDIYHDTSSALENHDYFEWHSIFHIGNKDEKIMFGRDKIQFIDSDHRKSQIAYSHLIQFMDLILGCVHGCLECTSENADKNQLAEKALPLIQRLIESPNNRRSSFNYVGRMKIEFFPKHDLRHLDINTMEYKHKRLDAFYTKRPLKIKNKEQALLFH